MAPTFLPHSPVPTMAPTTLIMTVTPTPAPILIPVPIIKIKPVPVLNLTSPPTPSILAPAAGVTKKPSERKRDEVVENKIRYIKEKMDRAKRMQGNHSKAVVSKLQHIYKKMTQARDGILLKFSA